ncbi:MAG: Gfo/Idh/MocA family oxidoreductase [Planctomycetota bacterium]|jgi:predicted dehydrogenase
MIHSNMTRRTALKAAIGFAAPFVFRKHLHAKPSETVLHASFGASNMALNDINRLAASPNLRLVAVADVDLSRTAEVRRLFPNARIYQDWRELLDRERDINSASIATPDHMHGPITMSCLRRGLNVYTEKPLTHTIHEARQLTRAAAERRVVTQMGIQIHSHAVHRTVVATIQANAIGKVREVHSWSSRSWGDSSLRPNRTDPVPAQLNWDHWLGVAAERPYIEGYYHPFVWRNRVDFGGGTLGDMGCHILDPVFSSLGLTAPRTVRSLGAAPNADSWALNSRVVYTFPGTQYTDNTLTLHWYDGNAERPASLRAQIGDRPFSEQGSIYIGENGVLFSPYVNPLSLYPVDRFRDFRIPQMEQQNHYLQYVEAIRGNGRAAAPFSYSGPLTETVLLGVLATRFPNQNLNWDAANLRFTDNEMATRHVRQQPRRGWEIEGL